MIIDEEYLRKNPNHIFVFGDNLERIGVGGAARFRYFTNTYGFITKKAPRYMEKSYFTAEEYFKVFDQEIRNFINIIKANPDCTYLISKLGSGLANRYKIFEKVIEPNIKEYLKEFKNVKFLW